MLRFQYDRREDIPEGFQELFTERGGKWECTGISGMKTQADVDRVQTALTKERDEHRETKTKLKGFGELDPEEVHSKLDRIAELEAAAGDNLDEGKLEELVQKRLEATLRSKTGPLERKIQQLSDENGELKTKAETLSQEKRRRTLHDAIREAAQSREVGMLPQAVEDALTLGERVLDLDEEGKVITKDGVGVTPGLAPADWLQELRAKKTHWWPEAKGAGARGSSEGGGVSNNPWSKDSWSMTEQGRFIREHGHEKAEQAARAAGSKVGAVRPTVEQPADSKS